MNIRKILGQRQNHPKITSFYSYSFSFGPFKQISFNSDLCDFLVDKRILKESVIQSFILSYKSFLEAIQRQDISLIEKITTPKFFDFFKNNFYNDYSTNNIRIELENHQNYSLAIENLKAYNIIYGLDLKKSGKQKINYGEQNLIPGTFLKKILFYNKDSLMRTKLFCPSIVVIDVIFTTNLKPIFIQKKRNRDEILHKSLVGSYEKYIWQFVTYSKFKTYDVPFVINSKGMEKFLDLNQISDKENLNLISFFESRQKEYEEFGWKINDINGFMPKNFNSIAF